MARALMCIALVQSVASDCGCGSNHNLHVAKCGMPMDEKVWGIDGSWEDGCAACRGTLEAEGTIQRGKCHCDKAAYGTNPGIWLVCPSSFEESSDNTPADVDANVTHPPVTNPPALDAAVTQPLEADLDAEVTCVSDSNCLHPSKHETCCSGKSHYVTIFACGENRRCGCLDHAVGCSYNSDCCSGSCLSGHCENPAADVDANATRQPALDAEVTHPPVTHPPALEADLNAEVTCVSDSNCLHPSKHETCCSGKSHYVTIFACGENRRCGCLDHAVGCSYNSDCCSGSCLSGHCENPGAVANASVVLV